MKTKTINILRIPAMLIAILMMTIAYAGPITPDAARRNVEKFLSQKGLTRSGLTLTRVPLRITRAAAADALYIFNTDSGFVIASGDDLAPEIMGYSDHGQFDAEQIPAALEEMLATYAVQIQALRQANLRPRPEVLTRAADDKSPISPIVRTKWDQGHPYNMYCPKDSKANNKLSAVGCVATAMAQAMSVWKWPDATTNTIPGYKQSGDNYPTITHKSLPVTQFDWANIKDRYTGKEKTTDASAVAIANLMHYCGKSVKMNYSNAFSGAWTKDVATALVKYFDYNKAVKCIKRCDYTKDDWDDIIYRELKEGRAVEYSGNDNSGSGHAFICDGYDTSGYYHINWGWSGMSDGYFLLSILDPQSQGTGGGSANADGFNYYQDAVICICPPSENPSTDLPEKINHRNKQCNLEVVDWEQIDNSAYVNFYIKNTGDDFTGSIYSYSEEEHTKILLNGWNDAKELGSASFINIPKGRTAKVELFVGKGVNNKVDENLYFYFYDYYIPYGQKIPGQQGWFKKSVRVELQTKPDSYTAITIAAKVKGNPHMPKRLSNSYLEQEYTLTNNSQKEYRGMVKAMILIDDPNNKDYYLYYITDEFYAEVPAKGSKKLSRNYELKAGRTYWMKAARTLFNGKYQEWEKMTDFGYVITPKAAPVTQTIGETQYATMYYHDRSLIVPEGITAYTYGLADGKLFVDREYKTDDVIPAATAVLLKADTAGDYTFEITNEEGRISQRNVLRGTPVKKLTEAGRGMKYYVLTTKDSRLAFYMRNEAAAAFENEAHKAYLAIPEGEALATRLDI